MTLESIAEPPLQVTRSAQGRSRSFATSPVTRLLLPQKGRTVVLVAGDIDWIRARRNNVFVHAAGTTLRVRTTLEALTRRLAGDQFVRLHRSAVVNVERIREIIRAPAGNAWVILRCGTAVPVSRAGYRFLRSWGDAFDAEPVRDSAAPRLGSRR